MKKKIVLFFIMINIAYIETWKEIIQKPSDFYREMPKTGGYFDPIVFATMNAAISLFIYLLFTTETEIRTFISNSMSHAQKSQN